MKLRVIIKISITSSIVLLCIGIALYSFFKISAAEGQKDFNLYELVPATASAVLITDDIVEFMAEADELTSSKNKQYLHASKLYGQLKQYINSIQEDAPHGISRQMGRMLLSFHTPNDVYNQVLYCRLEASDRAVVNRFVEKYASSQYPAKTITHKGEELKIYPMADGDFLVCYLTSNFMVLSYQKRLIEEVIDAQKGGKSLANDVAFKKMLKEKKDVAATTLYARLPEMVDWTEFDVQLRGDFIYLSGVGHPAETCATFGELLRRQEAVSGFPGDLLPASTFYFTKQSLTDWSAMLSYGDSLLSVTGEQADEVTERDKELTSYLMEFAGKEMMTCLFHRGDTTLNKMAAVLSFPMPKVAEAERALRSFASYAGSYSVSHKSYLVYRLPANATFARFSHFANPVREVYAAFYDGRLLLAPDAIALNDYVSQLSKGEVLSHTLSYQQGLNALSDTYQFMLMADLRSLFLFSQNEIRWLPSFLQQNADFFLHYDLFVQLSNTNGLICPNLVFKYK